MTKDQLEAELKRVTAAMDADRDAYVKVPRRLWEIVETWVPIINRARMTAPFVATMAEYQAYQEALPLLKEVVR